MKWGENNLYWGRPLKSILAVLDGKKLQFSFKHLLSSNQTFVDKELEEKTKLFNNFTSYYDKQQVNPIDPNIGMQAASLCNGSAMSAFAGLSAMSSICASGHSMRHSFPFSSSSATPSPRHFMRSSSPSDSHVSGAMTGMSRKVRPGRGIVGGRGGAEVMPFASAFP